MLKHEPTEEQLSDVEKWAAVGLTQDQMSALLEIDRKTLSLHYKKQLVQGKAKANAEVGKTLYQKAVDGDTVAAIWWTKAQMGWHETKTHELVGIDGGPIKADHTWTVEVKK